MCYSFVVPFLQEGASSPSPMIPPPLARQQEQREEVSSSAVTTTEAAPTPAMVRLIRDVTANPDGSYNLTSDEVKSALVTHKKDLDKALLALTSPEAENQVLCDPCSVGVSWLMGVPWADEVNPFFCSCLSPIPSGGCCCSSTSFPSSAPAAGARVRAFAEELGGLPLPKRCPRRWCPVW